MPVTYPFFPPDATEETTALRFYHRYLPASLVGGDFFHIVRLSDNVAGVFSAT
jgi:serine phosphatase RsbU (regulator of sigma subunit)